MRLFPSVLILIASCTDGVTDIGPISGPRVDYTALIGPVGTYGVRGTSSIVVSADGQSFSAALDIGGGVQNSVYPWHVHVGACGDGGGIVGTGDYPVLAVSDLGTAAASASVAFGLVPSVRYSVDVHLAPENLATIVACGDYVFEGTGDN